MQNSSNPPPSWGYVPDHPAKSENILIPNIPIPKIYPKHVFITFTV